MLKIVGIIVGIIFVIVVISIIASIVKAPTIDEEAIKTFLDGSVNARENAQKLSKEFNKLKNNGWK